MPRHIVLPSEELCSYYQSGQSTIALARRYACSPTTVAKHLRCCGVTLRCSHFRSAAVDAAALRRMYLEERQPIVAIAAHFGVSASTVGNKRRHYGIPLRPRRSGVPALVSPILTSM